MTGSPEGVPFALRITGEGLKQLDAERYTQLAEMLGGIGLSVEKVSEPSSQKNRTDTLPELATMPLPEFDRLLTQTDMRQLARKYGFEPQRGSHAFWAIGNSDPYREYPFVPDDRLIHRYPHTPDQALSLHWIKIIAPKLKPSVIRDVGPVTIAFLQAVAEQEIIEIPKPAKKR